MWTYPEQYDLIVVGAGHAGAEAAHIGAKKGAKTLLLTLNLDTICKLSCNPSIGGSAKGHLVREIDALGGLMGKIADRTALHWRMLNRSKGPAVHSPRAQVDRFKYQLEMQKTLENIPLLEIKQGAVEDLIVKNNTIYGVLSKEGIAYLGKCVIICSGTFMQGRIFI
ncbi:MAG: FAD-dependent oxidoreductase, partial [Parachlamydiales bacterium]